MKILIASAGALLSRGSGADPLLEFSNSTIPSLLAPFSSYLDRDVTGWVVRVPLSFTLTVTTTVL